MQANGGLANGQIPCEPGGTALGGGIASLNPLELTLTTSAQAFPDPDSDLAQQPDGTAATPIGWDARARNDSDQVLSVKRAAICVPEPASTASALAALLSLAASACIQRGARRRAANAR